jgi:hypothetical protein
LDQHSQLFATEKSTDLQRRLLLKQSDSLAVLMRKDKKVLSGFGSDRLNTDYDADERASPSKLFPDLKQKTIRRENASLIGVPGVGLLSLQQVGVKGSHIDPQGLNKIPAFIHRSPKSLEHRDNDHPKKVTKHSDSLLDRFSIFHQAQTKQSVEHPKRKSIHLDSPDSHCQCAAPQPEPLVPQRIGSSAQTNPPLPVCNPESIPKEPAHAISKKKPQRAPSLPLSKQLHTAKQSTSHSSALLTLFFGFCHLQTADAEPEKAGSCPVKCLIGEGNNMSLVAKLLKDRKPVEIENFLTRSNFIWTQKQVNKFNPLSVAKLEKLSFLKRLPARDALSQLNMSDGSASRIDGLVAALAALKYFRVTNLALLEGSLRDVLAPASHVIAISDRLQLAVGNHIRGLKFISRKVLLATTVSQRCRELGLDETEFIPKTFIVRGDRLEEDLSAVSSRLATELDPASEPLIVKPGEFSNRGNGILMAFTPAELRSAVSKVLQYRKSTESAVVQSYLTKPLLFKQRKFDIRCFALATKFFHSLHFFWYLDGYARTSSFSYDANIRDNLKVHLTNEAVQVKGSPALSRPKELRQVRARQQSLLLRTRRVFFDASFIRYPQPEFSQRPCSSIQSTDESHAGKSIVCVSVGKPTDNQRRRRSRV